MSNSILVMKGKKRTTYEGIKAQLDLAFVQLYPNEEYRNEICFWEDIENSDSYTWKMDLPDTGETVFLDYNKNTGEIFKR